MYPLKRLYAVWQGVREKEKVCDRGRERRERETEKETDRERDTFGMKKRGKEFFFTNYRQNV